MNDAEIRSAYRKIESLISANNKLIYLGLKFPEVAFITDFLFNINSEKMVILADQINERRSIVHALKKENLICQ